MSQDSRDQFEQAYSEDNGGVPVAFLALDRLGDSYGTPKVARAWYWWKRARAGVVVVLPDEDGSRCDTVPEEARQEAYNNALNECREAIEAAGVKVAV